MGLLDTLNERFQSPMTQAGMGLLLSSMQGGNMAAGLQGGLQAGLSAERQRMAMQERARQQQRDGEARRALEAGLQAGPFAQLNQQERAMFAANPQLADRMIESTYARRFDPDAQLKTDLARAQLGAQQQQQQMNAEKLRQMQNPNLVYEQRATAAETYGLPRGTREFNEFVMTGDFPRGGGQQKDIAADARAREVEAQRLGLKAGSPAYQSYVLTGKMPREDQQPLTATDKKAIIEADEQVLTNENAIRSLTRAIDLSKGSYSGTAAKTRSSIVDSLVPWKTPEATATVELDQIVTAQALDALKATFGAAPTEGERKILLDIQGSVNQSPQAREAIYQRAIEAAQRRLTFNRDRSSALRNQTYYTGERGPAAQGTAPEGGGGTPRSTLPKPEETREIGGKTYLKIDGKWYER